LAFTISQGNQNRKSVLDINEKRQQIVIEVLEPQLYTLDSIRQKLRFVSVLLNGDHPLDGATSRVAQRSFLNAVVLVNQYQESVSQATGDAAVNGALIDVVDIGKHLASVNKEISEARRNPAASSSQWLPSVQASLMRVDRTLATLKQKTSQQFNSLRRIRLETQDAEVLRSRQTETRVNVLLGGLFLFALSSLLISIRLK